MLNGELHGDKPPSRERNVFDQLHGLPTEFSLSSWT
jgi:hypothetical protein